MKNYLNPSKIITIALLVAMLIAPTQSFANSDPYDPVIEWNSIILNLIRTEKTTPPAAAREMAIMHIAMYEAVNSITKTHEPYDIAIKSTSNASQETAAIIAAYHTLVHLYPQHAQILTELKNDSLSRVSANKDITEGLMIGRAAAEHILELRSNDNYDAKVDYKPQSVPGRWEPTLPQNAPALYPHWGMLTPFSKTNLRQFWPQGPPALQSQEYAQELLEVKELGAKNSTVRTADQTEIAHFWEDGPGTFTPPGHWNVIAQQMGIRHNYTLQENARLFALLNIAVADAGILCWDTKYVFDFWRPITAIRNADKDGNPLTVQDENWEPLLNTPPFPEYTSGHSTFSGAAATVLAAMFGDNVEFTATYILNPEITRSFTSFSQAAEEAVNSRLYGGIHFRSGNQHGLTIGRALGEHITQSLLQPKPQASATVAPTPLPATPSIVLSSTDSVKTVQSVPVTAQTGPHALMVVAAMLIGLGGVTGYRLVKK